MKNQMMKFIALTAMSMFGYGAAAAEVGDIYDIAAVADAADTDVVKGDCPLWKLGSTTSKEAGHDAYFRVRLTAREDGTGEYWYKAHIGHTSEVIDDLEHPLRIGIFVSGELRWATYVADVKKLLNATCFTDVIFKYRTQPGDFALPIVLAANDDGKIVPASDKSTQGSRYYFDPTTTDRWAFQFVKSDMSVVSANWWVCTEKKVTTRWLDITLKEAGYNIQTVDFASTWETNNVLWRSVHENTEITVGASPTIEQASAIDKAVSLYVWSTNENAVVVTGPEVEEVSMPCISDVSVTTNYHVAKVTIVAGKLTGNFTIKGVSREADGGWSGLVLSQFDHFRVSDSTGDLIEDFITVPVRCVEPLPPSVVVSLNPTDMTAATGESAYMTAAAELTVSLSQANPDRDVIVTLTNTFTKAGVTGDPLEYVYYSENPTVTDFANPSYPQVRFQKGSTTPDPAKLYVYALRSDVKVNSDASTKLTFLGIPDADNATFIENTNGVSSRISAEVPEIVSPTEGETLSNATANEPKSLQIQVIAPYADEISSEGFTIEYMRDGEDEKWQTLEGKYKPGAGHILYEVTSGNLPAFTFGKPGDDCQLSFRVKSPLSQMESDQRTVTLTVKSPKSIAIETTDKKENDIYDEGDDVNLRFTVDNDDYKAQNYYVYLKPVGDYGANVTSLHFAVEGASGIPLSATALSTATATDYLTINDGGSGTYGTEYRFKAVLCTTSTYSESAVVTGYLCNELRIFAKNVIPSVTYAYMTDNPTKSQRVDSNYGTIGQTVPMGISQKLHVKLNDVAQYKKTGTGEPGVVDKNSTGDKVFKTRWFFEDEDGVTSGPLEAPDDGIIEGNPDSSYCTFDFPSSGRYTVTVELHDKDMGSDFGNGEIDQMFTFYVNVIDHPTIEITPNYGEYDGRFLETEVNSASINIELQLNNCTEPIVCELAVESGDTTSENPGAFVLKQRVSEKLGNVTFVRREGKKDIYHVTIPKKQTKVTVYFASLDGTATSLSDGFVLSPKIITDYIVPGSGGQSAKDYYNGIDNVLKVANVAPEMEFVSPVPSTNVISVALGQVDEPICWNFNDVTNDFAKGITVQIKGGSETFKQTYTNRTEANKAGALGFCPTFKSSGLHTVELTIKDTDNGTAKYEHQSMIWYYEVAISKDLTMTPHGPTRGYGTTLSTKYVSASGIGEGRIYANGDSGALGFEHSVNCQLSKTWTVYGYGYKVGDVDGEVSDFVMHYPDGRTGYHVDRIMKIDANGNSGATVADGYRYTDRLRDSFLYAWVQIVRDDSGTLTDTLLNGAIQPEASEAQDAGTRVGLPTEKDDDGVYDETIVEAIFSKEYLASDNMGDINQDRIPDLYFKKYGFSTTETSTAANGSTSTETVELDDLTSVAAWNDDVDSDGNASGDYLPANITAAVGSFVPGLKGSWATAGLPFTADLEIRGYGAGLNNAPTLAGVAGVKPDIVYTDPDTDSKSTLSAVEYLAWKEWAAANGKEVTDYKDADGNPYWSPERPTSPVLEDTDEDGYPDGFEYFYWYRAHVGFLENSVHKYQTGRKFDPRNPGEGKLITAAEIEAAMDPITPADATAKVGDIDNDGLADLLEMMLGTDPFDFDTDGDGLPDGWEVIIAGTDPLKAGDAIDNYDGDAMAYTTLYKSENKNSSSYCDEVLLAQSEGRPENEVVFFHTFAVKDANGDSDGVQWYAVQDATLAETETVTNSANYWILVADGVKYMTFVEPKITDDKLLATELTREKCFEFVDGATMGLPQYLSVGTQLSANPVAVTDGVYTQLQLKANIDAKVCNTAWKYGNNTVVIDGKIQQLLALGRHKGVSSNAVVYAAASTARPVALIHSQVYQQFGFDPRTAWNPTGYPGTRWAKTASSDGATEAVEGYVVKEYAFASITARTKPYTTYDEFLVVSYFLNNGAISDSDVTMTSTMPWTEIYKAYTTNPVGPGQTVVQNVDTSSSSDTTTTTTDTTDSESSTFNTNGADTDEDGVPDGWELYVMSGSKVSGLFNIAGPESNMSPFKPSAKLLSSTDTDGQDWDDLSEWQEYSGIDSCAWYAEIQAGEEAAYSTTIVRPTEHEKWLNKFFPTDPWSADTDGDGLKDAVEFKYFVYDGGSSNSIDTVTIVGGGLNPCTVDTDQDGLPDGWEAQFKGDMLGDDASKGYVNGMDGTVFDSYTKPGDINRDYDYDGLENWQEYMVGAMRCWRYDDPFSRWDAIADELYWDYDKAEGTYTWNPKYEQLGTTKEKFWGATLVDSTSKLYNPRLVTGMAPGGMYLTRVKNTWDIAFKNATADQFVPGGSYYIFKDRVNSDQYKKIWCEKLWLALGFDTDAQYYPAPQKYISCDPTKADTDQDGMDDYYELFHGMNPLLGASGVLVKTGDPCDIVYDAWYREYVGSPVQAWGNNSNYWLTEAGKKELIRTPQGNGFDFVAMPWLNGMASADPDGDDIRNQEEAIMPKMATSTWKHTDPTPLWMTDSSYSNSLVNLFWRVPNRYRQVDLPGRTFTYAGEGLSISIAGTPPETNTYNFADFDGYYWVEADEAAMQPERFYFSEVATENWLVADSGKGNWMFSFEENEGFDSDHDIVGDYEESSHKYANDADPLDADAERRRQAIYFPGASKPGVLQTLPRRAENHPICGETYLEDPAFLQFTVEAWVKADAAILNDGSQHVIVERAIWVDPSKAADEEYIRKNFQIYLFDNKWYAKYDSSGTLKKNEVVAFGQSASATTEWTHLAATYDGSALILYVNGLPSGSTRSSVQPEYGASALSTDKLGSLVGVPSWSYAYNAILIGASLKTQQEFDPTFKPLEDTGVVNGSSKAVGYALDLTLGLGWNYYTRYFQGYVDEVRIWDGARTAAQIKSAYMTRFDSTTVKSNQNEIYDLWVYGSRRHAKDSGGNDYEIPAELRYNFSFDSVPAAENIAQVAKLPHGFARAELSRPANYIVTWLDKVLNGDPDLGTSGYSGTVYSDPGWVMWIPNTVTHLPRYDGTTLDSFYWSQDFCGNVSGKYNYNNSSEPVSLWTQYARNRSTSGQYDTTSTRFQLCNFEQTNSNFYAVYEFTGRHLAQSGDDLIPLGGVYAQMTDNTVGLWDGQGPSSNWEITGADDSDTGLPNWWVAYAKAHYGLPSTFDWNTQITYNGLTQTAGSAYLRDLSYGFYADSSGSATVGSAKFRQVSDTLNAGLPDWWLRLYGLYGLDNVALADSDYDGLPNYVEYLLSEVFDFKKVFDPTVAASVDQYTPDYFIPVGQLYAGEIFTDFDQIADDWEDDYSDDYASRLAYDPFQDYDEDGWCNRSEFLYSKMCLPIVANLQSHASAADGLVADYPLPTIAMTLRYNGSKKEETRTSAIVVQAYHLNDMHPEAFMAGNADAVFELESSKSSASSDSSGSSTNVYALSNVRNLGRWSKRHAVGTLTPGNILLKSLSLQFCADPSSGEVQWYVRRGNSLDYRHGSQSDYEEDVRRYGSQNVGMASDSNGYRQWAEVIVSSDENTGLATLKLGSTGAFGTVNIYTGAFDIDLSAFEGVFGYYSGTNGIKEVVSMETQFFRLAYDYTPSTSLPRKLYLGEATTGYVREGNNTFIVFADLDGNGAYTAGEPYGFAKDVDVSWKGIELEIELTDNSPVFARMDLTTGENDRTTHYSESSGIRASGGSLFASAAQTRVRVFRWDVVINGTRSDLPVGNRTKVYDRKLDLSVRPYITEADILTCEGDEYDLDWAELSKFSNDITEVGYRLYIGNDADATITAGGSTNLIPIMVTRSFDGTSYRMTPVVVSPATENEIVYAATPTFKWNMYDSANGLTRDTYTAFRLVVDGVYDSGILPAPARDSDGNYGFKPALYAGDISTSGTVFAPGNAYSWKVYMYNSKFRSEASYGSGKFYLNTQTNGYEYGTANVAVRYFGPAKSYQGKVIRVRAYESPDFTGRAVAGGYVTSTAGLATTGKKLTANAKLIGIPKGSYYFQAWIDSNGNFACDPWESSGYLCSRDGSAENIFNPVAVQYADTMGSTETLTIYIEDADTDGDGLPDAWEYAQYGSLTAKGVELLSRTAQGEFVVNTAISGALSVKSTSPTAGVAGKVLRSALANAGTLALAMGVDASSYDTFSDALVGEVSEELADEVQITSLAFDANGDIVIAVEGATQLSSSSPLASAFQTDGVMTVKCYVSYTSSLAENWQELEPVTITVGDGAQTVNVSELLPAGVDSNSCFFKVRLEK